MIDICHYFCEYSTYWITMYIIFEYMKYYSITA